MTIETTLVEDPRNEVALVHRTLAQLCAGHKDGRNWLTTAEAVEEYHLNRKRKR